MLAIYTSVVCFHKACTMLCEDSVASEWNLLKEKENVLTTDYLWYWEDVALLAVSVLIK
jgi:hypothetical protein